MSERSNRDETIEIVREKSSELDEYIDSMEGELVGARQHPVEPLVGECVDDRHPSLRGRYRVSWKDERGKERNVWLPGLQGLSIRKGDRVLLVCPANWLEPIIVGCVDGFVPRPEKERSTAASLTLKADEKLQIQSDDGEPLVEVYQGDHGPVVRLNTEDAEIDIKGRLKLSARSIEMNARMGEVEIDAHDDVVIKGEAIHLN